jgi:hypothetical protein
VFHPWPVELHSPDSIPKLFCPTGRLALRASRPLGCVPAVLKRQPVQQFNDSTPRSMRLASNFAGYVGLCEADRRGYLRLFAPMCGYVTPFWRKNDSPLVKNQQPAPSLLRWGETRRTTPIFYAILPGFNPIQPCSRLFNPQYFFEIGFSPAGFLNFLPVALPP